MSTSRCDRADSGSTSAKHGDESILIEVIVGDDLRIEDTSSVEEAERHLRGEVVTEARGLRDAGPVGERQHGRSVR